MAGVPETARADWVEVLGALEARCEQIAGALRGCCELPGAYGLPEGLGPLPEELRARAQRLLANQRALIGALARGMRALRVVIDSPAPSDRPIGPALYVDRRC